MKLDPSWPAVGSKVSLLTERGAAKARVVAYYAQKGEVRLVFDREELNPLPADAVGKAHRIMLITTLLRLVKAAEEVAAKSTGGAS